MFAATDWVDRLLRPEIMAPFFLFAVPVLMWGIKSMVAAGSQARIIEAELQLKRELVAQGRSVEEIERIVGQGAASKLNG